MNTYIETKYYMLELISQSIRQQRSILHYANTTKYFVVGRLIASFEIQVSSFIIGVLMSMIVMIIFYVFLFFRRGYFEMVVADIISTFKTR